jgi:hypothetical protein
MASSNSPLHREWLSLRGWCEDEHVRARRTSSKPYKTARSKFPAPPFGELVTSIDAALLDFIHDKASGNQGAASTGIDKVSLVASYNWADQAMPSIVVPGKACPQTPFVERQ